MCSTKYIADIKMPKQNTTTNTPSPNSINIHPQKSCKYQKQDNLLYDITKLRL